jgi:high affinity sulfate transporter 1
MTAAAEKAAPSGRLARTFPGLALLRRYRPEWLRADLVAGVTLAAYLLPAGLGDAALAGLPPEAGLYACLFAGLVFWIFCSSQHAAVTVTSAISLLLGSSLADQGGGDPSRHAALAAATALLVAGLGLVAWLAKAGVLVDFVSETVMVGFKCGVALHLAATQLPKLFGFAGGHGDFWERTAHVFSHLGQTNGAALAVGAAALAFLIAAKTWFPRLPAGTLVIVLGIVAASVADLAGKGVKLIGAVPQGLPPLQLPAVGLEELNELLPLAMACFLLGAVETAAIGRMFARKHGYRFDANQEFLALAGSNLASGVGSGFAVSAGMSQSLVNESSGARTPVSGLVAAVVVLLITVFLSGLMRNLPQPVLAAIILVAVSGLIKVKALKRIWRFSRAEFAVAAFAVLGVLGSGLLRGVLIGAVLSLLLLLRRSARPEVAELGRVRGDDYFADVEGHAAERIVEPGVFAFRVSSAIMYFNAQYVEDQFFARLNAREDPVRLAVFFLGNVPGVDLAGAEMLADIHHAMRERGIGFRLAEAHGPVRAALAKSGYEAAFGPVLGHETVAEIVGRWRQST